MMIPSTGSRRQFLTAAGALGLAGAAGLLSGCGSSGPGERPVEGQLRDHTDALGNRVQIPVKPQRILAMQQILGAGLLAVDAPVVGVAVGNKTPGTWPDTYDGADTSTLVDVGDFNKPDFEKILPLAPDLIVLAAYAGKSIKYDEAEIEQLGKIAPMVYLEYSRLPGENLPGDRVKAFAELAGTDPGKVAEHDQEYQAVLGEVRQLLGPDPTKISAGYLMFTKQNFQYGTPYQVVPLIQILLACGVRWAYDKKPSEPAGMETLREVKADLLLASDYGDGSLKTNPLFASMPAVQAGQAITTTGQFASALPSYQYYIAAAQFLRERLTALPRPLRTGLG